MDNSLTSLIDTATSILVLLPQKPTFDSVAAGLSFYLSISDRKPTSISCPSPIMVGFNRIIGVNKIASEVGNKNLTIKFKGYEASNIEKVSYDIIDGEFNLTVVPKVGFVAPQKEQVDTSFSGLSADLVILIGGTSDADFPVLSSEELSVSKIVHIGTRSFNSTREVLSFAKPGAAVSELIASLIKDTAGTIDPDIATNLVMGIEEGSSNFASSEVTPDTFEIFAYLMRNGGRRQAKVKLSPMGFPPGSIPTQPYTAKTTTPGEVASKALHGVPLDVQSTIQPGETDAMDIEGTGETEQDINPPDDWLQPKVFKNSNNPPMINPDSFSENKG
jgi:hypothetical protein